MKTKGTLNIAPFSCKLHFIVTDQLESEMNRLYKKHKTGETFDIEAEGCVFSPTMYEIYLVIDLKYLTHNTISHEVFHVVNNINDDRDIVDEESGAWLTGYVSEFIYKFLKKKKIDVKDGGKQ
jgi:hypothetical protein